MPRTSPCPRTGKCTWLELCSRPALPPVARLRRLSLPMPTLPSTWYAYITSAKRALIAPIDTVGAFLRQRVEGDSHAFVTRFFFGRCSATTWVRGSTTSVIATAVKRSYKKSFRELRVRVTMFAQDQQAGYYCETQHRYAN